MFFSQSETSRLERVFFSMFSFSSPKSGFRMVAFPGLWLPLCPVTAGLFLPLQSAPSALSREPYPSATHYRPRLTFGYALMFSLVSDYPQISTLLVLCLCIFQWAEARLIKRNIYLHFVHIDFNKQETTQWSLASTHQYNHNICGLLIF